MVGTDIANTVDVATTRLYIVFGAHFDGDLTGYARWVSVPAPGPGHRPRTSFPFMLVASLKAGFVARFGARSPIMRVNLKKRLKHTISWVLRYCYDVAAVLGGRGTCQSDPPSAFNFHNSHPSFPTS